VGNGATFAVLAAGADDTACPNAEAGT